MNLLQPRWFASLTVDGKTVGESLFAEGFAPTLGVFARQLAALGEPKREILLRFATQPGRAEAVEPGNALDQLLAGIEAETLLAIAQTDLPDAWMVDPKVVRWTQLHINREAYVQALPGEYQELRRHIESRYPERAEQIKWRTE